MSYDFSPGYKIRDQYALHFLTFTVMGWIDIFSRRIYRDIILESMHFCQSNKDLKIGACVIMTNPIHTIWTSPSGHLSDTIRDFKTFTSKAITKAINEEPESRREWLDFMFKFYANATNKNDLYKLWTNNNHPEAIYSKEFLFTKMHYIHQNPVKAGLVTKGQDYIYSSASNYFTGEGIFKVDLFY